MTLDELKSILMQAPVGFAVLHGPELVFELANSRYLEMVDRVQVVGRAWAEVFPELVGTPTQEVVFGTLETGRPVTVTEFLVPLKRGGRPSEGYFTFILEPTRDASGRVTGAMVIATEVTELVVRRREAEELAKRLRVSEERFRGAQETSLDAFISLRSIRDEQGRVIDFEMLYQNAAAASVNGLDPAKVAGTRLLQHFPQLPGTELWKLYLDAAETGKPFKTEVQYVADGFDTWFRILCSRVGDGIALSFSDIGAQKRMELSEKRAREQAEFMASDIAQQAQEMERALVALRQERDRALARVELEANRRG